MTTHAARSLVIHAHLYQPPRENPAFDEIEAERSAAPWHDWNERIERECYRALVAARVMGTHGRIARVVNTLEHVSFNVGATLFEWIERHAPDTYRAILQADRASAGRLRGHGNAIAQPYHHLILPLASRRDKVTEVRWGIADFARRFGRQPEGMWLPETAVDDETLDVLAQEGIRFTILAPYQIGGAPPNGHPGRYTTASGRTIALFPYDGDMSHGIAFGGLVRDATEWGRVILDYPRAAANRALLISAATDGETYGHHHRFAEMALARVLEISAEYDVRVENFASWLARHPATHDVELVAPSSWSCAHGVERWRSNCGCRMDTSRPPHQEWRAALRDGLDALAAGVHEIFEREGTALFGDAWATRDAFGQVDLADPRTTQPFVRERLVGEPTPERVRRGSELLEMEHDALRMYTSCAWFFDDIGGLEPRQVLRYAARAAALSGARERLEGPMVAALARGLSIHASGGTGADVYRTSAAAIDAAPRVAAAAAALASFDLPLDANLPARAVSVAADGDVVTVTARRTGASARFRVAGASRTRDGIGCEVAPLEGGAPQVVPLADFPEGAQHAIHAAFRHVLLAECLSAEERARVARGDASLRHVVVTALVAAIERLAAPASGEVTARAARFLDLMEQLEIGIPFDVQTAFWLVWRDASDARRAELAPMRERLGFEPWPASREAGTPG